MGIRTLLVDDQVLFVENLKIVLETYAPDLEIVGTAENGRQAVLRAREYQPQLILMDLRMPLLDGVGATKEILAEQPNTRIIMLTVFDDDEYVYEALNLGAAGYLLKNIRPGALVSSIKAVLEGAVLISPVAAKNLVANRSFADSSETFHEEPPWLRFCSNREREVLQYLIDGYSNREIAEKLNISGATIRNYISTLYDKLGADDRFHAVRIAKAHRGFLS